MKPEEFEVYVIPPNFMEGGTLFGGLLKTRNTIEAVILGLAVGVPVLHLPFSLTVRVVILCLTALPLVLLALIGVSGMSLSAFIRLFFCFLHNRRILSRDGTQGGKNGKTLLPSWAQQRKSDCEAEDPPLPKSRSRFSVDLKQRSVTQFKTFLQEEEAVQPLNALADYVPIEKIEHGVIYTRDHRYADGWLNLPAMAAPDSRLCRYAIYESGFAAFDIALYSSQLYPEGETLSSQDNAFHAAVSFGLCEDTCAGTDIITRGEAADLLYALLTGEFTVAPPPILETIPLNNKEGVHLNSYLLELQKIPEPIRQAFAERGWQYTIDYEYLARLSEERNMSCIGATNYGSRQITVSSAGATVHEFGHFLDELMGFPSQTEGFYQEESGTAAALLRPYALTNEREYFADCFVYWLTYRDNSKKMAALCSAAPKTYAYLLALESQNWQPAA